MGKQIPRFERKSNGAAALFVGHTDEYGEELIMTH